MHPARSRLLLDRPEQPGPVLYWMHRELRSRDNWALLRARELAAERARPLCVAFCLVPAFGLAGRPAFAFLLRGLRETAERLGRLGVGFALLRGEPGARIAAFAREIGAGLVVTDADPARLKREWLAEAAGLLELPIFEIDGRNVAPARLVSNRREYMARTIRPKIRHLLPEFLTPFPEFAAPPIAWTAPLPTCDWDAALAACGPAPEFFPPGEAAAAKALRRFLAERLPRYADDRNTPLEPAGSRLSPYLHFGQISAQRVALETLAAAAGTKAGWAFLEQLVIRRELAENFCLYTPDYDTPDAFPDWARRTLEKHGSDARPHLASDAELEDAATPDPLWNAAQRQLLRTGHMHGWLRMYWAKQLLLWSPDAETAMARALRLNDSLSLDGRDVNGYAGIAWSIGGVHDRPWPERPVFGTVRSMTFAGARRKFDVAAFLRRFPAEAGA